MHSTNKFKIKNIIKRFHSILNPCNDIYASTWGIKRKSFHQRRILRLVGNENLSCRYVGMTVQPKEGKGHKRTQ